MDTLDDGHDNVIAVKWIIVLLYAPAAIIPLGGIFEPTQATPVENLEACCLFLCRQKALK